MNQSVVYSNLNDATTSRRYSGYPLNSTLVSSYTPDTIRSIITHAAAGQPYSTTVWIRITRVGVQISAQDPQIARSRIPVFIPIGLAHDIFMLPSINNVICIVYDEVQSNMKGVLLYVVNPSDAQLIREEFRTYKQQHNSQKQTSNDNRYSNPNEIYPSETTQAYTPISVRRSPFINTQTIRQPSPKRIVYVRDLDTTTPTTLPQLNYTPSKGYQSDHRRKSPKRHRSSHSPNKRSSDSANKERKHKSRSPEKSSRIKLSASRSSPNLVEQQQQLLLQQQQMAAWQAAQQMPLIPMGIYNRYVPKTIPLPTGETLKTSLPPGLTGAAMNGAAVAYIEPVNHSNVSKPSRSPSKSPPRQQQNRLPPAQSSHHHHRRHHVNDNTNNNSPQSPRLGSKNDDQDDTKQYLKMLVEEMQAMKVELDRLRQMPVTPIRARSDSVQVDLREIRSHLDHLRSRMALPPGNTDK